MDVITKLEHYFRTSGSGLVIIAIGLIGVMFCFMISCKGLGYSAKKYQPKYDTEKMGRPLILKDNKNEEK